MPEVVQKEMAAWVSHNVRPMYYYWQFAIESGVWVLFWVAAIVYFFVNKQAAYRREYKFAFIWFLASLVLLSAFPEKKPRYLLPLLIPGALLIAFYMNQMIMAIRTKGERTVFRCIGSVMAFVLLALPVLLYVLYFREKQAMRFVCLLATVCSWTLCATILTALFGKKGIRPARVFIVHILAMMMFISVYAIQFGSLLINEERHSIRLLRDNKALSDMDFYYNDKEELRMELVYEANRRFYQMNTDDSLAIEKALPFLLVSGEPIEKLMSGKNVVIEPIGVFDINWKKKSRKSYNPELVQEAAIIRAP
jgi:hypothetical protein